MSKRRKNTRMFSRAERRRAAAERAAAPVDQEKVDRALIEAYCGCALSSGVLLAETWIAVAVDEDPLDGDAELAGALARQFARVTGYSIDVATAEAWIDGEEERVLEMYDGYFE